MAPSQSGKKLGLPENTRAVARYLEASPNALDRIRKAGHISGPALWAPALIQAAALLHERSRNGRSHGRSPVFHFERLLA